MRDRGQGLGTRRQARRGGVRAMGDTCGIRGARARVPTNLCPTDHSSARSRKNSARLVCTGKGVMDRRRGGDGLIWTWQGRCRVLAGAASQAIIRKVPQAGDSKQRTYELIATGETESDGKGAKRERAGYATIYRGAGGGEL